MKNVRLLSHIQFSALVITPFLLSLFLLALFFGCSKEAPKAPAAPVLVSIENMQIAYGKGLKFEHMYNDFVGQAVKERLPNIAHRYRAIARSEAVHAALHAEFLKSKGAEPRTPTIDTVTVGKTLQTLKMALSLEEIETSSMYPNLIRTAELEKLPELAAQLTAIKEADALHTKLLQEVLDKSGKIEKSPYLVCVKCGYIATSAKAAECPNCRAPKASLESVD
jgi:rubrerythrin